MTEVPDIVVLFTDIENSTGYWEAHPKLMQKALGLHNHILEVAITSFGGNVVKHMGDGVFAVFNQGDPLGCTLDIQHRISQTDWGQLGDLRVRVAMHAGPVYEQEHDYFGPTINRTARLSDIGWGGQTLITSEVLDITHLPDGAYLNDLGVHLLKDLSKPIQVFGLLHDALPHKEFPPLRSLSSMHPRTLTEALQTAQELNVQPLALYTLVGVARLMAFKGDYSRAGELVGLVLSHPVSSEFAKDKAHEVLDELRNDMPSEDLDDAFRRGSDYDIQTVVDNILVEFT